MPYSPEWKELRVGIIGLAAVAATVVAILLFGSVGGIRGKKVTMYVVAANATGILRNTEVKVGGKRAGTVRDIRFRDPTRDTTERLLIEFTVLESALPLLREDSYAEFRPAGTIIGAPIVDIHPGDASLPGLRPGDTLRTRPHFGTEAVSQTVTAIGKEFSTVMREWRVITADVGTARGTFEAMRFEGPRDFAAFRVRAAALMARVTSPRGTIGMALQERELQRRTASVLASIDTIGALLESDRGSIGRFRRDRTLVDAMEQTRGELTEIQRALGEARGTAGRWQHDRAVQLELEQLGTELELMIEDVKRRPGRYLRF